MLIKVAKHHSKSNSQWWKFLWRIFSNKTQGAVQKDALKVYTYFRRAAPNYHVPDNYAIHNHIVFEISLVTKQQNNHDKKKTEIVGKQTQKHWSFVYCFVVGFCCCCCLLCTLQKENVVCEVHSLSIQSQKGVMVNNLWRKTNSWFLCAVSTVSVIPGTDNVGHRHLKKKKI